MVFMVHKIMLLALVLGIHCHYNQTGCCYAMTTSKIGLQENEVKKFEDKDDIVSMRKILTDHDLSLKYFRMKHPAKE